MLIRFRVRNFRSIKNEQELSLVASSLSEHPEAVVHPESYSFGVLRGAAVYGANASGKSTLCYAMQFVQSAVAESHRAWKPEGGVPREPFALDAEWIEEPSSFVVDILLNGIRYEYGFVVDSSQVLEEWLFAYPKGRRQEWFTRDATRSEEFVFSRLLSGENRTISALTRANSLFLSAAAQNNHEVLSPIHNWFAENVWVVETFSFAALAMNVGERCTEPEYRARIFSILKAADLGISGIELVEPDPSAGLMERIGAAIRSLGVTRISLRHRTEGGVDVSLPFSGESAGTRTLFALAGAIVDALDRGGTLVVDELDRSLHPHLALQIVEMFNDPETNPNNAQLIFNTHDTNLLDNELLRRDQIWFTEKSEDGATHLYPLTDFRARKHENLERGYLQGRYGAVPAIQAPDLLQSANT